jgi:hypothetical protein
MKTYAELLKENNELHNKLRQYRQVHLGAIKIPEYHVGPHVSPGREFCQGNSLHEPEGERLRSELEIWLKENKIYGIVMDTQDHTVDIHYGPNMPDRIQSVLTKHGSIYIIQE